MAVDYGVDFDSSFTFQDGDLKIVSDKDNLTQAIYNRLNTLYGALDLFYDEYGSYMQSYIGWRKNEETLEFIRLEINYVLASEPRVNLFECDVKYDEDKGVTIDLVVYYNEEDSFELNYILNSDGVEVV